MHPLQKIINDANIAQSKLSGKEFNLGDLIKMLETAPQDMLVDIILPDGTVIFPRQDKVEVCVDGNDSNYDDNNTHYLDSCIGGNSGMVLNLAIFTSANDTKYEVKKMLQEARSTVGKYLNWAYLMDLDTPIFTTKLEQTWCACDSQVVGAKIENGIFHLICRDSSND